MKYRDILELVRKQSIYVDKKSLSYTAGLGKAGIKKSKEELIDAVMKRVSSCRDWLVEYMLECRHELALNPETLEEIIGCTEEERLRWTADGHLDVVCYKEYGAMERAPYYEIVQVAYDISDEVLKEWREEDEEDNRFKPLNLKTTSYEYKNGFIVEVSERESENGLMNYVYLSHKKHSEKMAMFGIPQKLLEKEGHNDWESFSIIIRGEIDEYIEHYMRKLANSTSI